MLASDMLRCQFLDVVACRKRVLAMLRELLDSYGKGQAPRILITGEPILSAINVVWSLSMLAFASIYHHRFADYEGDLPLLQGTASAGRSASWQRTTSRQSLRCHFDRYRAVE